jgi:hypothetical protein
MGGTLATMTELDRHRQCFGDPPIAKHRHYKNRPPGSRPAQISVLVSPRELGAIDKLAELQGIRRPEVLRRALNAYARSALTFDEWRSFYPPK